MDYTAILPPSDHKIDFDLLDCAAEGPEVTVVDDYELQVVSPVSVLELIGPRSKVTFFTDCHRPYLVVHFKTIDRFLRMTVLCVDDTGKNKLFDMSNKSSFITVDQSTCSMPMEVGGGWQYLCIELDELLANAFGSTFLSCKELTIYGSCRVSKIYFQSRKHADVELPSYLRVVVNER